MRFNINRFIKKPGLNHEMKQKICNGIKLNLNMKNNFGKNCKTKVLFIKLTVFSQNRNLKKTFQFIFREGFHLNKCFKSFKQSSL